MLAAAFTIGVLLTETLVVADEEHPEALVIVTVYIPLAAFVTLLIEGFCCNELNPFGPVQNHEVPALAVRFNVLPEHNGLLLAACAVTPLLITTLV